MQIIEVPLAILARILAQSCVTPLTECREGLRITMYFLDSIAKGTSCFHYFSYGVSLQRPSFDCIVFAYARALRK